MTRRLRLATRTSRPGVPAVPLLLNVVFDGNSLTRGNGASNPMPNQVMALLPGTAIWSNLGVSGATWRQMDGLDAGSAADVDAAYVGGRKNVLVMWEDTNTIFGSATSAQCITARNDYLAHRIAANPWRVVVITCLPRGGSAVNNQRITVVNDDIKANYVSLGAHAVADVRQVGSPFNFSGEVDADFVATQVYWQEMASWTHLTNAGIAVIAPYIVTAINSV